MPFGGFFRRVTNTRSRGGSPPSENVRPGVAEARRLLDQNPNADRRDLVDQLVRQRNEPKFRGIPQSEVQRIQDRARQSRERRRR